MKKFLIFSLFLMLGLSLASCEDEFDINKLQDEPKLLVYCFPTECDSTVIAVYRTVPVSTDSPNTDRMAREVVEAHIIYKVNGVEMPVKRITEEDCARLSTDPEHPDNRLAGQYCAIAPQRAGDRIDVEVRAEGLPAASASTHIPEKVEAEIDDVTDNFQELDDHHFVSRMAATFADDGSTKDYYMVRMDEKRMAGEAIGSGSSWSDGFMAGSYGVYLAYKDAFTHWDFSGVKWHRHYVTILPDNEPVFKTSSQLDEDFGFDAYGYDDMAYFFNDQLFNGSSYTLHLDIYKNRFSINDHYSWGDWDEYAGGYYYTLQFYTLTKEYYRYIKSKNDSKNNSWADSGLMQAAHIYSNVRGGVGIVAGYAVSAPCWWVKVEKWDHIYTEE